MKHEALTTFLSLRLWHFLQKKGVNLWDVATFQLRCFSFFLNFLCSFSWMTYSSLSFLCVILVTQNGKGGCVSHHRGCLLLKCSCRRVSAQREPHSCSSMRLREAAYLRGRLCPQFIKHAGMFLDNCCAGMGSGVILRTVSCPFFTQKTKVLFIKPRRWQRGPWLAHEMLNSKLRSEKKKKAILQHDKEQNVQRNGQLIDGPSLHKTNLKGLKRSPLWCPVLSFTPNLLLMP